jgi:hypothetical protein
MSNTANRPIYKPYLLVATALVALAVFLFDSLSDNFIDQSVGKIAVLYSGIKIKSARCTEVGVALQDGHTVLATVADNALGECRVGDLVQVRHYRTRILRISSYKALRLPSAGSNNSFKPKPLRGSA